MPRCTLCVYLVSSRVFASTHHVLSPSRPRAQVESVKAASDVYSPVAGKVSEINAKLKDEPSLLNKSPYDGTRSRWAQFWGYSCVTFCLRQCLCHA
jgi:hypothetical protein